MESHEREKRQADRFAELVILVGVILTLLFMASCQSVRYVPVESVRTEYINRTDTVTKTDSIIHEKETIIQMADSTTLSKLGLQLKENEKAILILRRELERQKSAHQEHRIDTVVVRDSVNVPFPVEKELTWYQEKCITWFPWILFAAFALLIIILKPWRWLKSI